MRSILIVVLTLVASTAWAFDSVKANYRGDAIFKDSIQYYIEFCADRKCQEITEISTLEKKQPDTVQKVMSEVAKKIRKVHYSRGMEIDDWTLGATDKGHLNDLLSIDHTSGDGSPAWTPQELGHINAYLMKFDKDVVLYYFWIMENYMSGTGITSYFFVYNTSNNWLTVIEKFEYAE